MVCRLADALRGGLPQPGDVVTKYTSVALTRAMGKVQSGHTASAFVTLLQTTAMNAAVATMCCTGVVAAFSANAVVSASLTPKTVDLLCMLLDATTQGLIATKDALLAQPEAAA